MNNELKNNSDYNIYIYIYIYIINFVFLNNIAGKYWRKLNMLNSLDYRKVN